MEGEKRETSELLHQVIIIRNLKIIHQSRSFAFDNTIPITSVDSARIAAYVITVKTKPATFSVPCDRCIKDMNENNFKKHNVTHKLNLLMKDLIKR